MATPVARRHRTTPDAPQLDAALEAARTALEPWQGALIVAAAQEVPDGQVRRSVLGAVDDAGIALVLRAPLGDGCEALVGADGRRWWRTCASTGPGSAIVLAVETETVPASGRAELERIAVRLAREVVLDRERRTGERLRQLLVTAGRAVASLDLDEVLSGIVRDATRLLDADSGDMLLLDPDGDRLRVVAVWNFPPDMLGFELRLGEGISSEAIRRRGPVQVDDYLTYEHRAPALDHYRFGAVLCAPLVFRGQPIGTLNVHAGVPGPRFRADDVELLDAFAGHAAIAIDHARRYENEVRLGRALGETNRELTRSLAVQQRLAEQVILDGGPNGIALVLAETMARHVVIEDQLHRCIAGASPDGGGDWRALSTREWAAAANGHTSGPEPFSVSVRVGREVLGHLRLSSERELGPIDRALVDIATTGVALEFAKVRAALEVEERLRGEAFADLLAGTYPDEDAIAIRAARLGYDLTEPRDVLVIVEATPGSPAGDPGATDGMGRRLAAVRERLSVRHPGSFAGLHAQALVVLATHARTRPDDPRALAEDLRRSIGAAGPCGEVTIAIGRRCVRPDDYGPSVRAARESLDLLLKLGRTGATIDDGELGPYALLLRATSREDLEAFADRQLRPLVDHDRTHGAELLRTLRAHLECDRVQRRTAAHCFIHVNTVVYRVRRIEELLGVSLDDPKAVFDLTLALRILDLTRPYPSAV